MCPPIFCRAMYNVRKCWQTYTCRITILYSQKYQIICGDDVQLTCRTSFWIEMGRLGFLDQQSSSGTIQRHISGAGFSVENSTSCSALSSSISGERGRLPPAACRDPAAGLKFLPLHAHYAYVGICMVSYIYFWIQNTRRFLNYFCEWMDVI